MKSTMIIWIMMVCMIIFPVYGIYTAPDYSSVNLTLGQETYVAPDYSSVNLTLGLVAEAAAPSGNDTCTAPVSGDWNVNCSDYCNWSSAQDVPGNIVIGTTGVLTLSNNFTFTGSNQEISVPSGCTLVIDVGGRFK